MSDLTCTFEDFKQRIKFTLDQHRSGTLKEEERDQLVKMVNLSYLEIYDRDAPTIADQAKIALQLFQREMGLLPPLPGIPASRFWDRFNELSQQPAKSSGGPGF